MYRRLITLFAAGLLFTACNKQKTYKPVNTAKLAKKERQGYPDWYLNPYQDGFQPSDSVCAAAQSTMGLSSKNIEAAISDAKIQVKNSIAEQITAEVGLLQERSNEVFRDMSGKEVGGTTLKIINQNYQQTKLVGMRYLSTQIYPNPRNPEQVYQLGCIRMDFTELAKKIQDEMLSAAQTKEAMEFEHQEAMLRFDKVRQEYLNQKQGGTITR